LLGNTAIGEARARDEDESVDDGGIKKWLELLYYADSTQMKSTSDEHVANLANSLES
jgi:hypothetical protein